MKLEKLKLKDLNVKNYFFQAIHRTILETTILNKGTSKKIWNSLKKKYEGNARVKRSILQSLRKDFETLDVKVVESITYYFACILFVARKMRVYGEKMKDFTIVENILRSLTDKFNYVVCSIEESMDVDALIIDELQSSVIGHEKKSHKSNGDEQALKVIVDGKIEGRGRGRGNFRGKGKGRGSGSPTFNKATNECYKCHKLGHFHYAGLDEHEEMLLMSYMEMHEANCKDTRFFDSWCSNHMFGDKSMFSELTECFTQLVRLGNNTIMKTCGKGNVKLHLNGFNHVISEVFYVLELNNNLLSLG